MKVRSMLRSVLRSKVAIGVAGLTVGLEQLLDALDVAEPARPPYGVDPRLWARTCELADELAGALADDDEPDHDEAASLAAELHELLRPFV